MQSFEKLGVFYLGRPLDPKTFAPAGVPLLYDSRDLTTHAMCVGMTGSGKTGLCLSLLEEAAIDGVPAIVVDPKGDLANLLLTFPDLAPEDFRPWVRQDDAARKGLSLDDYAAAEAKKWREGLAGWGEDGARIRTFRDSVEFGLYTPGSDAARPLSILASFAAPPAAIAADSDLLRERVSTTVASLLGLLGIAGDPLQSREHILLASLLDAAWRAGKSYDLASLIADVQKPPLAKVGVLDLETFYPVKERFGLAMAINNLLAAPGFDVWMRGEPLDAGALLYTASGKPRISILSIAHLSDAERMFFVALLLEQVLGWMRTRQGSTSLRALFYMDEIFGYLPPVANPPSKKPMLTLLKQARAFGLGMVLATQNPVDLDYKALSNIGTWFLGRLQTERDKARVLDGLEGAATASGANFDRAAIDRLLSGLRSRVFLLHDVHLPEPELFESRWALSYLAGPLDREQLKRLAGELGGAPAPDPVATAATPAPRSAAAAGAAPVLAPDVPQAYLPVRSAQRQGIFYAPCLLGLARVRVIDDKLGVEQTQDVARLVRLVTDSAADWLKAEESPLAEEDLVREPEAGSSYAEVPVEARGGSAYKKWSRDFADTLFRTYKVELMRSPSLGEVSRAGESERDFRTRLGDAARAERDRIVAGVQQKYAARVAALEERIRRAADRVEREKQQASQKTLDTAISIGATVLGALFGRRTFSASTLGRAATSAKTATRAIKERQDVGAANESLEELTAQRQQLESDLNQEVTALAGRVDPASETFERVAVRPKKSDLEVRRVLLAWAPHDAKTGTPLWE
ncbi:MAG: type IV secretion system DNA-binding domain-containing protein [Thermoanaerobaculia bacterium]